MPVCQAALRNVMEWMSVVPVGRFDEFGPSVSVPLRRGQLGDAAAAFLRLMVSVHGDLPSTYQRASQFARGRIMAHWALSQPPHVPRRDERVVSWAGVHWWVVAAVVLGAMLLLGALSSAITGQDDDCTPSGDQSGCTYPQER